jgi:hypothetical protein
MIRIDIMNWSSNTELFTSNNINTKKISKIKMK